MPETSKYKVVHSPSTQAQRTFLFKDGEMIAAFMGKRHASDCQKACDLLNEVSRSHGKFPRQPLKLTGNMLEIDTGKDND